MSTVKVPYLDGNDLVLPCGTRMALSAGYDLRIHGGVPGFGGPSVVCALLTFALSSSVLWAIVWRAGETADVVAARMKDFADLVAERLADGVGPDAVVEAPS